MSFKTRWQVEIKEQRGHLLPFNISAAGKILKMAIPLHSIFAKLCFVHPFFRFLFLVTFDNEVTKIRKYYVIFGYILQGKMGKTEKTRKKITQLFKVTRIPKDENMG